MADSAHHLPPSFASPAKNAPPSHTTSQAPPGFYEYAQQQTPRHPMKTTLLLRQASPREVTTQNSQLGIFALVLAICALILAMFALYTSPGTDPEFFLPAVLAFCSAIMAIHSLAKQKRFHPVPVIAALIAAVVLVAALALF